METPLIEVPLFQQKKTHNFCDFDRKHAKNIKKKAYEHPRLFGGLGEIWGLIIIIIIIKMSKLRGFYSGEYGKPLPEVV